MKTFQNTIVIQRVIDYIWTEKIIGTCLNKLYNRENNMKNDSLTWGKRINWESANWWKILPTQESQNAPHPEYVKAFLRQFCLKRKTGEIRSSGQTTQRGELSPYAFLCFNSTLYWWTILKKFRSIGKKYIKLKIAPYCIGSLCNVDYYFEILLSRTKIHYHEFLVTKWNFLLFSPFFYIYS